MISLIVATLGRPTELQRLLMSLCGQTFRDFEVIIVDQSDEPQFALNSAATRVAKEGGLDVRIIHSKARGLSVARNIGLKMARGDIIGFPDDDCWYESGIVERVATIFSNEESAFICGNYSEPGKTNSYFSPKPANIHNYKNARLACSVGLFIRKSSVADGTIVFDELLGAGTQMPAGEETELVMKLLSRGVTGKYIPDLTIYHKIGRPSMNIDFIKKQEEARGYIYGKYSNEPIILIRFLASILKSTGSSVLCNGAFPMRRVKGFTRALESQKR